MLSDLFAEVVVPRAVWDGVIERRPDAPGADALQHATWIRVVENPAVDVNLGLDPGKTAAILLAEILRADLVLIDERVGRRIARERGLEVRGTLGVLVLARQCHALPALKPVLDVLVAEGFRIAPALVREALASVGEDPKTEGSPSTDRS